MPRTVGAFCFAVVINENLLPDCALVYVLAHCFYLHALVSIRALWCARASRASPRCWRLRSCYDSRLDLHRQSKRLFSVVDANMMLSICLLVQYLQVACLVPLWCVCLARVLLLLGALGARASSTSIFIRTVPARHLSFPSILFYCLFATVTARPRPPSRSPIPSQFLDPLIDFFSQWCASTDKGCDRGSTSSLKPVSSVFEALKTLLQLYGTACAPTLCANGRGVLEFVLRRFLAAQASECFCLWYR